jgi:hypothetical protein
MVPFSNSNIDEITCGPSLWRPSANGGKGVCSTTISEKIIAAHMLLAVKHCALFLFYPHRTSLIPNPDQCGHALAHAHTHRFYYRGNSSVCALENERIRPARKRTSGDL